MAINQQGPDRNTLMGAIQRRKKAQVGNQQMQRMNDKRNRVFKPEDTTQATDNMPRVKPRPQGPTDNMPQTKQRQPTPMPQPKPRPGNDNTAMAKKLQAMRNGLGTRMGG